MFVSDKMAGGAETSFLLTKTLESFFSFCEPKNYLLRPINIVIFLKINFKSLCVLLLSSSENKNLVVTHLGKDPLNSLSSCSVSSSGLFCTDILIILG